MCRARGLIKGIGTIKILMQRRDELVKAQVKER